MPEPRDKSVAELVFDVSERTSTLIREEVELAKAEVTEKVTKLLRGSAVGAAAGVFAFLALILVMEGFAWLLNEEVFDNSWAGFFVEAAIFLLVAAGAGWFAYTSVKAGSPPVPEQAIEEAKLIRETIEGEEAGPAADRRPPREPPRRRKPRERADERPSRARAAFDDRPAGPHARSDPRRHRGPAAATSATRSTSSAPAWPSSRTGGARSASTARS